MTDEIFFRCLSLSKAISNLKCVVDLISAGMYEKAFAELEKQSKEVPELGFSEDDIKKMKADVWELLSKPIIEKIKTIQGHFDKI